MPAVVLREKTVNYDLGEHEPPDDGKRLLFLHGDNGTFGWWERQLNDFSRRHDTYAMDLPGHGATAGPHCESVQGYRDTIGEFTEGMALEPAVLIGHSIGARAALALAAHAPELVEALVLVSMYTRWHAPAAVLKTLSQAVETGGTVPLDESLLSPKATESVLQWARRQQNRGLAEALLNDWTATAAHDAIADLEQVKQPVLLIVGADDPRMTVAEAEELAAKAEQAQLVVIPEAGHLPMVEQAQEFDEALDTFLRGL